jgi:hypothetical protein
MNQQNRYEPQQLNDYCGEILYRHCSPELHNVVTKNINVFRSFDETNCPLMLYLAAWSDNDGEIWYEFVGNRLLKLLNCSCREAARTLRDSVLERRIYKNYECKDGVQKESIDGQSLYDRRNGIREESKNRGQVEAVYKLMLPSELSIWIKDIANVIYFPMDKITLSSGSLTIVSKEMELEQKCERLIRKLQNALSKIKTLNGLLPICANCKKIRDDKGYWNQVEDYIRKHSTAEFSHGICPDCARKLYPEFFNEKIEKNEDSDQIRNDIPNINTFLSSD